MPAGRPFEGPNPASIDRSTFPEKSGRSEFSVEIGSLTLRRPAPRGGATPAPQEACQTWASGPAIG